MKITRAWAMPSHLTFSIKPIGKFLSKIIHPINSKLIVDPFANRNHGWASDYNDINPDNYGSNLDALDYLKTFETQSVDGVLFDPPYSLRQLKECYDGIGISLSQNHAQNYFTDVKKEICRVLKPGGFCVSFGWNSNGIGKKKGFEIEEIMLVSHGGNHHDTIVTYEKNMQRRLDLC